MNMNYAGRRLGGRLAGLALVLSIGSVAGTPGPVLAADTPAAAAPKPGLNLNAGMGELDKMLDKVNATPDQRTKIKAVIFDAVMSMGSEAPALKATVAAFGKSLMSPQVDRAGLESARVAAVGDFDVFTKVLVKALGDAADVLTPDQRAKLAASMSKKGG